ncbi:sel1 repeat family protein [Pseudoalteromonas luteoviolacea]|uniref:sel1 repeat family protein n=1 Tax=Pseudoalteromonas luteoviolacea TaxID=43657 RepID=UPI000A45833E|nr:sel1 repeat family protein [Pseudoalteromonas luteoviolacea]
MRFIMLSMIFSTHVSAEVNLVDVVNKIDSTTSYKLLIDKCPADYFPKSNLSSQDYTDTCSVNPNLCLERCESGDANYCSSLANVIQNNLQSGYYSEALFSKSCQLGLVIGCTNRASGLIKHNGDSSLNCAVETFKLACAQKDEWGCTMYGAFLAQGKGVKRNFDKALEVLKVSCQNGIDHPACQHAKNISSQIKTVLNNNP